MDQGDTRWPLTFAVLLGAGLGLVVMWPRLMNDEPQVPASAPAPEPSASSAIPSASGPVALAPEPERDGAPCPAGMVHVVGDHCPFVAHRCAAYMGADPHAEGARDDRRCERFHDRLICEGRPARLAYCIDRFEYPNLAGAKPAVMVDYPQARRACVVEGKRLCEAEEWAFACEGKRTLPYATGLQRDANACNIDRRPREPNLRALSVPRDVSVEVERLDQRVQSGALGGCVSPFGVADTIGNVAEWVHDREGPQAGAIAGGHYGRAVATCRTLDSARKPTFAAHDTGFRCCADALDGQPARRLLGRDVRLPRSRKITP
jgi:hypothetical protein